MVHVRTEVEADTLIARYIAPHPVNPGLDEYWLARPGVSVWAVVGSLEANIGDANAVARLYQLTADELSAVRAFYARYRAVIDNRLAQNDNP